MAGMCGKCIAPTNRHPERYMSRTIRYTALVLAVAAMSACSSSITEPTAAAPKCTTAQNTTSPSCVSFDYINPKV